MRLPTVLDVYEAKRRLRGRLESTPLRQSAWLSSHANADVRLKLEALNLTGSFKIRGALNAVLALTETRDRSRDGGEAPLVVAASAGNHGQAIALATRDLGFRCAVFTPADAPEAKKAGIRRHGAQLFDDHADYDLAEQRAKQFAVDHSGVYVSPYADAFVIGGAGTIGLELVESMPECEVVLVPMGGGGLASGIGLAIKAAAPHIEFIGVEVDASTPFTQSLKAGRIVHITPRPSLADGLTGNLDPEAITFPLVQQVVDRIVTVGEDDLARTMRGMAQNEHLVIEASGVTAAAAVLSGACDLQGRKAAIVITGSNVDLGRWLTTLESAR